MSKISGIELSQFGRLLGLEVALISYSPGTKSLSLEFNPETRHYNEKGMVHGGCLQGVADEAMRIFAAKFLGHARAVTRETSFHFDKFALPGESIIFAVKKLYLSNGLLYLFCTASQGGHLVAHASSSWLTRQIA